MLYHMNVQYINVRYVKRYHTLLHLDIQSQTKLTNSMLPIQGYLSE